MTREEALAYFKRHIDLYCVTGICREAEEMAIKALEQEPCDYLISREELLKAIDTWDKFGVDDTNSLFRLDNLSLPHYVPYIHYDDVIKCIKGMPLVNPQPKTGHWIGDNQAFYIYAKCSECGSVHDTVTNYCPECGCLMDRTEFDEYVKTEGA